MNPSLRRVQFVHSSNCKRAGERVYYGRSIQIYSNKLQIIVSKNKHSETKLSEHMKAIGKKGGLTTAKKGKEYMSQLGKKGFQALAKKKKPLT